MENNNPMKEQIENWKRSGMSMNAYCQKVGITYHSFLYWKKRYDTRFVNHKENKLAKTFVPIEFHNEEDNQKTILEITIETDGKMLLRIGRQ